MITLRPINYTQTMWQLHKQWTNAVFFTASAALAVSKHMHDCIRVCTKQAVAAAHMDALGMEQV